MNNKIKITARHARVNTNPIKIDLFFADGIRDIVHQDLHAHPIPRFAGPGIPLLPAATLLLADAE